MEDPMGNVRRVYVEKKPAFAVHAKEITSEAKQYLGIEGVESIRVLIRYDVENISKETYEEAKTCVFSEPPVDDLYEETVPVPEGAHIFSVEYLPGQFDQRADSAVQCVRFLNEEENPIIQTATTYIVTGEVTEEELLAIRSLTINPVDSRVADEEKPETLVTSFPEPEDIRTFDGFISLGTEDLRILYDSLNLAMTFADFRFIQDHFAKDVKRDPTVTEIRVLDTYWSDHCRHTTFLTELTDIAFDEGDYRDEILQTFEAYKAAREKLYAGRTDKPICLMDLAIIGAKQLKKEGKLTDQEESDEINACSIIIPVDVDGETQEWLLNFKNETHNHPTEIEPFGGAATCLGGAIRDPLSGRTYVYQAMRITGAADPTKPQSETLHGKLPQKKIVKDAAHGYSSYGNQIGLATGYVKEIYHPGYVAKRMEIGAVLGAAPRSAVMRETSRPDDVIILLGGETGRDGIGGATGSSKVHTEASIEVCGAEVQKGNAPTERKLQRLFRRPEVSKIIRKCNDFGAGGVSVAIGELADGLDIDLDAVPKKYAGLDGTEIAISESQERMAVVVGPEDVEAFLAFAAEENLEATRVAVVTEAPELVMHWRGKEIVRLSRAFMNTNGAHQETKAKAALPSAAESPFADGVIGTADGWNAAKKGTGAKQLWLDAVSDLNEASQRGLVEMFDSSIGAASVTMPYGGARQLSETQAMIAKIPVRHGQTNTVSFMSYGFDPFLSSWSPYHGAAWAVTSSVAKVVASGGDHEKIRFTFQEYFERMGEDPYHWGLPLTALLGAYKAQTGFGLPSIGGKDSMSGSFEQLNVPPTLVSFAVDWGKIGDVITPELKEAGNILIYMKTAATDEDMPDFAAAKKQYNALTGLMREGKIRSAFVTDRFGAASVLAKMAFGNDLGVQLADSCTEKMLFAPAFADFVLEVRPDAAAAVCSVLSEAAASPEDVAALGTIISEAEIRSASGETVVSLADLKAAWEKPLEKVFRSHTKAEEENVEGELYTPSSVYVCRNKVARPKVFIPVFPGTNCEYDSARAFEEAGAEVSACVFRNLNAQDIRESVDRFVKEISEAQIIMFPGGFSAGDEPDGSAKFFATAFRNAKMKEAVMDLLTKRDGLALGICNGFQALIKLGLVPEGKIAPQDAASPTLTYNTIGRHISRMVYTKIVSTKSPWLAGVTAGDVIASPASHGEGRFVAPEDRIRELFANGQVATQYCTFDGRVTMADDGNVNGSYCAVEGITSPDGRVLGKMAHIERRGNGVAVNITGEQDMKVFASGVAYFR